MTIVRKVLRSDALFVESLLRDTWPTSERVSRTVLREIEDMFSTAEFRPTFFVAEDHGVVVGCGAWNWSWINYGMYEMCWCCVRPDYRGRGIGRMLVQRRLDDIREISSQQGEDGYAVFLSTPHREMYERYGFRSILQPSGCSALDGDDSHLMMLHSSPAAAVQP